MLTLKNFQNILSKKIKLILHMILFNQTFRNLIGIPLLISLLGGYIIFEIQKWDSIRTKKIECFESIVSSINELSKTRYDEKSLAPITLIYNFNFEVLNLLKSKDELDKDISRLKLSQIRQNYINSLKQDEIQKKVLIESIKRQEILLKIYYGYSVENSILPLGKIISTLESNQRIKKKLDEKLIKIYDKTLAEILKLEPTPNKQKVIEQVINQSFNEIIEQYIDEMKQNEDTMVLFNEEANKFIDVTYSVFIAELNTPLFKLINKFSRKEFSKIVYDKNVSDLKFEIVYDKNHKPMYKEVN